VSQFNHNHPHFLRFFFPVHFTWDKRTSECYSS